MSPRALLTVIRPGMLSTVQDLGRWGYQDKGVPVGGPMDAYSHAAANRLVGNDDNAPALEITLIGPELEASEDVTCAVAGASFAIEAGGREVRVHESFVVPAGARLRFGARGNGARATLAVRGGFDVEPVFGSCATNLTARMGPFGGHALKNGDVLAIGSSTRAARGAPPGAAARPRKPLPLRMPAGGARLRVIPGPHHDRFTPSASRQMFDARFTITTSSNRMGYRLDGPVLEHLHGADILSDATPVGSLQVPASGHPILLMADRQTTGGYPKIGTVIAADLPIAGQLAPGDWIEFVECTRAAAIDALGDRRARLDGVDV